MIQHVATPCQLKRKFLNIRRPCQFKKNITYIESVQKHFTRLAYDCCNISFSSYANRLNKRKLKSPECRRLEFDLILVYIQTGVPKLGGGIIIWLYHSNSLNICISPNNLNGCTSERKFGEKVFYSCRRPFFLVFT